MGREWNREMFFERKGLHYRSSWGSKTVLCVRVFGYVDFKRIGVFSRMCKSVCLPLSCVCERFASHREPRFDQSVIGVKTENGDPFSCPATSAAL